MTKPPQNRAVRLERLLKTLERKLPPCEVSLLIEELLEPHFSLTSSQLLFLQSKVQEESQRISIEKRLSHFIKSAG